VDVSLGTLDVIVKIVSERVDQIDGVVSGVIVGVSGEEYERDVADVVADAGLRVLQLHRRLSVREEDLRCRLGRFAALFELLHKYFADHYVVLVLEDGREDYSHSIRSRLHEHRLFVPIVDDSPLLAFGSVLLKLEVLLEDRRETVPLQETRLLDQLFVILRQTLQIEEQRHVIALFGRCHQQ